MDKLVASALSGEKRESSKRGEMGPPSDKTQLPPTSTTATTVTKAAVSALLAPATTTATPTSTLTSRRESGESEPTTTTGVSPLRSSPSPSFRRKSTRKWGKLKMAASAMSAFNAIAKKREDTMKEWNTMQEQTAARRKMLESKLLAKKYELDVNDTLGWIAAKVEEVNAEDDDPHAHVQAKLARHEAFEAEVAARLASVNQLKSRGEDLVSDGHETQDVVESLTGKLDSEWEALQEATRAKRHRLEHGSGEIAELAKFTELSNEVIMWCERALSKLQALPLAESLARARADVKQHSVTSAEINAHKTNVENAISLGQALISADNFAKSEIDEKVTKIKKVAGELDAATEKRAVACRQCLDLHMFNQLADEVEDWHQAQIESIQSAGLGQSLNDATYQLKKDATLRRSMEAQGSKVKDLDDRVALAAKDGHYAIDDLQQQIMEVHEVRAELEQALQCHESQLRDSYEYYEYHRDCSEVEEYIHAKTVFATDESFRDHSNLTGKLSKLTAFEAELKAYAPHIDALAARAQAMCSEKEHHREKDIVELKESMERSWQTLLEQTKAKEERLAQAQAMYEFNKNAAAFQKWLKTIEAFLAQSDLGNDLDSVLDHIQKQEQVEEDAKAKRQKLAWLEDKCKLFTEKNFADAEKATELYQALSMRYAELHQPLISHATNLSASLELHRFLLKVQDEEAWLQLKLPIVTSEDYGDSVTAVNILTVRLKGFESEIFAREESIGSVADVADELLRQRHFASAVIQERKLQLLEKWDAFKDKKDARKAKLAEALHLQTFLADAGNVNSALNTIDATAHDTHCGVDEDEVKMLLNRHVLIGNKLSNAEASTHKLNRTREKLVRASNEGADDIDTCFSALAERVQEIRAAFDERTFQLEETLSFYDFRAQADDVLAWVEEGLGTASEKDCGATKDDCIKLRQSFQKFADDVHHHKRLVMDCVALGTKLIRQNHREKSDISEKCSRLNAKWAELEQETADRTKALANATAILAFHEEAAETMEWIREKEEELAVDDFGVDVASVEVLQRKHGVLERDLAALGNKLESVFAEAGRLVALHPAQSQQITAKQAEMASRWETMQDNAVKRKEVLDAAHKVMSFISEAEDLFSWLKATIADIVNVKPANDVADAERIIANHVEMRLRIESQQSSVDQALIAAEELVQQHLADALTEKVQALVSELAGTQEELIAAWDEYNDYHHEALYVQEFHREIAECDAWFAANKPFFASDDVGDSMDAVDLLIRKYADLEKSLDAQGQKVTLLTEKADSIVDELETGEMKCLYRSKKQAARRLTTTFEVGKGRRTTLSEAMSRRMSRSEWVQQIVTEHRRNSGRSSRDIHLDKISFALKEGRKSVSPQRYLSTGQSLSPTRPLSPLAQSSRGRSVSTGANTGGRTRNGGSIAPPPMVARGYTLASLPITKEERLSSCSDEAEVQQRPQGNPPAISLTNSSGMTTIKGQSHEPSHHDEYIDVDGVSIDVEAKVAPRREESPGRGSNVSPKERKASQDEEAIKKEGNDVNDADDDADDDEDDDDDDDDEEFMGFPTSPVPKPPVAMSTEGFDSHHELQGPISTSPPTTAPQLLPPPPVPLSDDDDDTDDWEML